jgi:group I intron endonuclease
MPTCKPGVYVITNKFEEIYYVGQTSSLSRRWSSYKMFFKNRAKNSLHRKLLALLDKYGADSFTFTVLEVCASEVLIEREGFWIDFYRNQYPGLVANNEGPNDKPPMSEEGRKSMIAALTGVKRPEISAALKGRKFSDEHRARISAAKKLQYSLGLPSPSARAVTCIDTGDTFANCLEAAHWLRDRGRPNADNSHISKAARGAMATAYGFRWRYESESAND